MRSRQILLFFIEILGEEWNGVRKIESGNSTAGWERTRRECGQCQGQTSRRTEDGSNYGRCRESREEGFEEKGKNESCAQRVIFGSNRVLFSLF